MIWRKLPMNHCPDEDRLALMLEGLGTGYEDLLLAGHVQVCGACQARLEGLTAGIPLHRTGSLPTFPDPDETIDPMLTTDFASEEAGVTIDFVDVGNAEGNGDASTAPGAGSTAPPAHREIAGFAILGELGQGGMGVVYRARHPRLNRLVALKMIRGGPHARPEHRERFLVEAETIARLKHPNILQIYDIGEADGLPYVTLELLDGGTLAQRLAGAPQPGRSAAELVATLARAIHEAHKAGVVHRDLKPSNVLFDSGGTAKVTDFGLAKRLEVDSGATATGQIMGSPSYMAPEQARGANREVGTAADVYALGAILYEMLVGRPPFRAATAMETVRQVIDLEPVAPSRFVPKLPHDLETICLKCLEKAPERRYASAEGLADDLARYLHHEPILGRRTPAWERGVKWARRRPTAAALLGLSLIAATALTAAGLSYEGNRRREERRVAEQRVGLDARLFGIQQSLSKGDWQAAAVPLATIRGELDAAPAFADLKERAGLLDAEVARRRREHEARSRDLADAAAARDRLERFRRLRDEALFRDAQFTGLDQAASLGEIREAAEGALGVFATRDREGAWMVLPPPATLTGAERAEIVDRSYELLLILADATAQPLPGEEARGQAARALRLLDLAASMRPPTRAYCLRRAACLDRAGDPSGARLQRDDAVALEPRSAFDHVLIGQERLKRGHVAAAEGHFESALRDEPGHFWARCLLAVCHLKSATPRPAQAIHLLTACLDGHSDRPWLYLLRGFAAGQLGATAGTLATVLEGPAAAARRSEAAAHFHAAEEDYANAVRLLEASPNAELLYILLVNRAVARQQKGQGSIAEADLREAIRLDPRPYQAYVGLADVLRARGDFDGAAGEYGKALAIRPDWAPLHRGRADVILDQIRAQGVTPARIDSALADLDRSLALEAPGDSVRARDQARRGQLLYLAGRHAEALAACDAALAVAPDYRETYRWRLASLLELKRHDDLLSACDDYLRRGGASAEIYRLRALARISRRDFEGAISDNTQALALEPDSPRLLSARGWAYLLDDAPRPAQRDFEAALRRDPSDADSRLGLASARVQLGEVDKAVQEADEALSRGPVTAARLYKAARIYAQAGAQVGARGTGRGLALVRLSERYHERSQALILETLRALPPEERAGFWRDTVRNDPALEPLRRRPKFVEFASMFVRSSD